MSPSQSRSLRRIHDFRMQRQKKLAILERNVQNRIELGDTDKKLIKVTAKLEEKNKSHAEHYPEV